VPLLLISTCGSGWTQLGAQGFADAQILVVVFTCNHCPTRRIIRAHQGNRRRLQSEGCRCGRHQSNDVNALRFDELAWSDLSDSFAEMKIRAAGPALQLPYLYDATPRPSRKLTDPCHPHVFVFDAARKLRYEVP